jgi:hypothetical protein
LGEALDVSAPGVLALGRFYRSVVTKLFEQRARLNFIKLGGPDDK